MKHPTNEEWMSYVYDECGDADRRRLEAHAGVCPECRSRVAAWRAVGERLDADRGALSRPARPVAWQGTVGRLLAAAALLALGIGLGRWGMVSPADVRREIDAAQAGWTARIRAEQTATDRELAETVRAMALRQQDWIDASRREWTAGRIEDQRAVQTALRGLESRHDADAAALHAGLLRLARETGNGFEQTQDHLAQLAGYTPGTPAEPGPTRR